MVSLNVIDQNYKLLPLFAEAIPTVSDVTRKPQISKITT